MALDFSFSPEHEAVREMAARFAEQEMKPLVRTAEEDEKFPRELFRKWGALGLLGVRYPEEDGGSGMDKVADCIIREEFSRVRRLPLPGRRTVIWASGRSGVVAHPLKRSAFSGRRLPGKEFQGSV